MKKQRYFIHAIILDANDRKTGCSSRILELNQNSTKEFNLSLRAKEMLKIFNTSCERKADGVLAIVVSFNKI